MRNSLIFLEFNEVSFTFVRSYIKKGFLKNFKKIIEKYGLQNTHSEKEFSHLEPWIQWVTVHTGKDFDEHKIFRLGDAKNQSENIWNVLNRKNINSFLLSPMNAVNPENENSVFIPDPWTSSSPTKNFFYNSFHRTVSSMVNDNSKNNYKFFDLMSFFICFLRFARFKNYFKYFKFVTKSLKQKWYQALFLDLLLADIFFVSYNKKKYPYGSIFLNAAAHIQHHYFFSSKVYSGNNFNPDWYCSKESDPVLEVYELYDLILGDILKTYRNSRIILATGLSQVPVEKPTYYWRLEDHENFLKEIGISFLNVKKRMSRDFLINFSNSSDLQNAETILANITIDDKQVFEVDSRSESIFVTLSFPDLIDEKTEIKLFNNLSKIKFFKCIVLVALKNGQHNERGFYIDSDNSIKDKQEIHIKQIYKNIISNFEG